MTMVPQKVVFTEPDRIFGDDAPEEVEFGPFLQGVVISSDPLGKWTGPCLIDVASGRTISALSDIGHVLVKYTRDGPNLVVSGSGNHADRYNNMFIQTYPTHVPQPPTDKNFVKTMRAMILGRRVDVDLSTSLERRVISYGEEVDANLRSLGDIETLGREGGGDRGAFTDESIMYLILGLLEQALEASEAERGVQARLDGVVTPLGES